ncbi:DUF6642 family protein [Flavobacterium rhizosphaerae]|uniref:DUF6642 family protein n=1 Tax=Flavobacterium rhizosphaerae TaxID=3163298 RepID=A0ABW8YYI9_9FLAO
MLDDDDKFIFCLEAVADVEAEGQGIVFKNLEKLAFEQGIGSIYKMCDSIEGLEDSLNALLYNDHNFKNYEIIYLVMPGEKNNIRISGYYYSLEEIAELFVGRLKGKVLHFSNTKVLDLTSDEAQYFLDVTGAKAISGYGETSHIASISLDRIFFSLFEDEDNLVEIVEDLHRKHYALCKMLDFRLYY